MSTSYELNQERSRLFIQNVAQECAITRGLTPLALEPELLLNRVKQGGRSAKILGHAFISSYTKGDLNGSLGDLVHLDAEGFRLYHQILHIRFALGMNERKLEKLAQQIEALLASIYEGETSC